MPRLARHLSLHTSVKATILPVVLRVSLGGLDLVLWKRYLKMVQKQLLPKHSSQLMDGEESCRTTLDLLLLHHLDTAKGLTFHWPSAPFPLVSRVKPATNIKSEIWI